MSEMDDILKMLEGSRVDDDCRPVRCLPSAVVGISKIIEDSWNKHGENPTLFTFFWKNEPVSKFVGVIDKRTIVDSGEVVDVSLPSLHLPEDVQRENTEFGKTVQTNILDSSNGEPLDELGFMFLDIEAKEFIRVEKFILAEDGSSYWWVEEDWEHFNLMPELCLQGEPYTGQVQHDAIISTSEM